LSAVNETSALLRPRNDKIGKSNSVTETDDEAGGASSAQTKSDDARIPFPRRFISDSLRSISSSDGHKSIAVSIRHNVLNNTPVKSFYQHHRRGLSSADESMYISSL
jgi:hypothetical protein